MAETAKIEPTKAPVTEQKSELFNMQFVIRTLILNWQVFLLSLFIFVGVAMVYLRYATKVYQVSAKVLIKDEDNASMRNRNSVMNMSNLGFITSSDGFDNELELLKSTQLAEGTIRDLKLYVDYYSEGRVTKQPAYGASNPISIDMDAKHLDELTKPVAIDITKKGSNYSVKGNYGNMASFEKDGALPMTINTNFGVITIKAAKGYKAGKEKDFDMHAFIYNPSELAVSYANSLNVSALSKTTTIASVTRNDIIPQRAMDFLTKMVEVYNRQANDDKNQIAIRTEEFINERLQKINAELGTTDGAIEKFKQANNIIDVNATGGLSMNRSDAVEAELAEMGTQILLMQSIRDFMNRSDNRYQTLPSNVGLTDNSATALITQYNNTVLERTRLLRSASEQSPNVQKLTATLDELSESIKRAMDQTSRELNIKRSAVLSRKGKYDSMMSQSPNQERVLTEIGRQQTVKSSLYIMLLQKREENSITLAATSDKGRLIDKPAYLGKVQPRGSIILLLALCLGLAVPLLIFFLKEYLRFRIEGRNDVEQLTTFPVIADIAMANETAKAKADIVVHENKNNQMEEIFRAMRTNIQFMLKEKQNVIMFTSSTSGEGKTFTASNLAVSFALLGKKVVLVGLDIRRPRLSKLFEIKDKKTGITNLLMMESPTVEDIRSQIIPSGVNDNLELLMAGTIPPNPAELVARKSLDDIFAILRKEYDYVIVDTAPIGLVTDTLVIGRITDATVVICRADYTEKSAFAMINGFAESGKLPNVAIAINGIDMSQKKYGYAYGYGRYGKYGKYGYRNTYGYGGYSRYGNYGYGYGAYTSSHYSNPNDTSIKK